MAVRMDITSNKVLKAIILIIIVCYSIGFAFWGRGCNDPYYWLKIYETAPICDSLSSGTLLVGHFWCELFGYNILSMRILGWICCIMALTIPYVSILPRGKWFEGIYFYPFIYAVILMGYGTFNEFSPGTISFLLLSIEATFAYKYWKGRNNIYLVAGGISVALATICRFPNVLSFIVWVFFILALFAVENWPTRSFVAKESLFLAAAATSYSLLDRLLSGKGHIVTAFSNENSGTHTIAGLFVDLFSQANEIIIYLGFICLVVTLAGIIYRVGNKFVKVLLGVFVVFLVTYFYKENIGFHRWFNRNLHVFLSSLSIFLIGVYCYKLLSNREISKFVAVVACFLILCVLPMGSDTAWLKLFPALLVPVPFVLAEIKIRWSNILPIVLFAIIAIFSIQAYANNNISKGNGGSVLAMTQVVDDGVLKGIRISPKDKNYIESLKTACSDFENNVIFYGDNSHFAYGMVPQAINYDYPFFFSPYDTTNVDNVIRILTDYSPALFDFEMHDWDYLHRELERIGYEQEKIIDNYAIFIPCQQQ